MIHKIKALYNQIEQSFVRAANDRFNALTDTAKKRSILAFAGVMSFFCVATMTGILNSAKLSPSQHESIQIPKTEMPMKTKQSSNELIPLGKMKGEIDGEFDSFYVAIDKDARVFINRNISYSESAYDKNEAWKEISMDDLKGYERDLHFIPVSKSKGLKP